MPLQSNIRRPLILASVMAATFMIAVEATIVSTAMPQIAGQLGDLHLYAWVFSAFLLTQTATTVVFGKLADIFGRKPILLIGIFIFLLGSLLCGFATSMPGLIAFRLIQGVGGGAIQPVSLTIIGDLYPARERGKIQGWLASVWGISSVLGPLAGGLIINHLSWAWVFWVNLPVGIAAAIGFGLYLREDVARQTQPIDVPGAVCSPSPSQPSWSPLPSSAPPPASPSPPSPFAWSVARCSSGRSAASPPPCWPSASGPGGPSPPPTWPPSSPA